MVFVCGENEKDKYNDFRTHEITALNIDDDDDDDACEGMCVWWLISSPSPHKWPSSYPHLISILKSASLNITQHTYHTYSTKHSH